MVTNSCRKEFTGLMPKIFSWSSSLPTESPLMFLSSACMLFFRGRRLLAGGLDDVAHLVLLDVRLHDVDAEFLHLAGLGDRDEAAFRSRDRAADVKQILGGVHLDHLELHRGVGLSAHASGHAL